MARTSAGERSISMEVSMTVILVGFEENFLVGVQDVVVALSTKLYSFAATVNNNTVAVGRD
jgi:hypothetical protein